MQLPLVFCLLWSEALALSLQLPRGSATAAPRTTVTRCPPPSLQSSAVDGNSRQSGGSMSLLTEAANAAFLPRGEPASALEPAPIDTQRSALVVGWFYASERELNYVRKIYQRNGYPNVVVVPSVVSMIAKPRGWYRTLRRHLQPGRRRDEASAGEAPSGGGAPSGGEASLAEASALGRHFDVVHCLSGGFLSLYVLLRSHVPLTFSTLLLDSTPILPKPAAFTRFARAYLNSLGFSLPLKLFPRSLHTKLVELRWNIALVYIQWRHALSQALGRLQGAALDAWTGGPVSWALNGDWERVARHALGSVLEGASEDAEIIFLHNPDDPYLDTEDVASCTRLAQDVGFNVTVAETKCEHVQAIFSTPRTVFGLFEGAAHKGAEGTEAPPQTGPRHAQQQGHADAVAARRSRIRDLVENGAEL